MASSWTLRVMLALALVCGPSWAVPPETVAPEEKSAAREAATAGIRAFQEGNYDTALDLLHKAEHIVHAPPHLIYIARAHAAKGEFVLAREALMLLINEELPADAPTAFKDAQAAGLALKTEIEPKIGRLSIRIQGATAAVTVTVDGKVVPETLLGLPYPVDPGVRTIIATADGQVADEVFVTIGEGQSEEVTLEVQAPPQELAPPPKEPAVAPPPPKKEPPPPPQKATNPLVFVGFGTAAAGLIVGAITGSASLAKTNDARSQYCSGSTCDPAAGPTLNEANMMANVSNIAFALAAVGVGVGVYGILSPIQVKPVPSSGAIPSSAASSGAANWPRGRLAISADGFRADVAFSF